ncbi:hypothetical protein [Methanooceanicella nereidis]|uniref:hypothetical protein n=1 Tax=Methanooceanicella nereidis TaxID=2052831 RepID=UPI001E611B67|nr:hypothetical protein [Methanocella sp. CWC-04]
MGKNSLRVIMAAAIILLFVFSIMDSAVAIDPGDIPPGIPTPVPKATSTPPSSSGGSSYDYSPPVFQPYEIMVLNSAGEVIGTVKGISASDIRLHVQQGGWDNGYNYEMVIDAKLNGKPVNPIIDIAFKSPEGASLPEGFIDPKVLAVAEVNAKSDNGWDVTHGTSKLTVKIPGPIKNYGSSDKFYVLRNAGGSYEMIEVRPSGSTDGQEVSFEINSPNGFTSTFTLVKVLTAIPTPEPTPTPTPEPTPVTEQTGINTWTILLGILTLFAMAITIFYFLVLARRGK